MIAGESSPEGVCPEETSGRGEEGTVDASEEEGDVAAEKASEKEHHGDDQAHLMKGV